MPTNLGRVRGSFIFNGNALSDGAIKSELSGQLVLDKDIYICNSSDNHPYFVYQASNNTWIQKGTISGVNNFDGFLSIYSSNAVQNKIITSFVKGLIGNKTYYKESGITEGAFSIISAVKEMAGKTTFDPTGKPAGTYNIVSGICMIDFSPLSGTSSQIKIRTRNAGTFEPTSWSYVDIGTTKLVIARFQSYVIWDGYYGEEKFDLQPICFQESGGITFPSISTVSVYGTTPSSSAFGGDCQAVAKGSISGLNTDAPFGHIFMIQDPVI